MDGTSTGSHLAPGILAEEARKARRLFRQALMVRGVLLTVSVGVLGLVAYLLMPIKAVPMDARTTDILLNTLGLCSALCVVGAIFFVPVAIPLEPRHPDHDDWHLPKPRMVSERLHARAIHAGSWSSVPALLGFGLVVMGGNAALYMAFLGATVVSSVLSFPRWRDWERACAESDDPTH